MPSGWACGPAGSTWSAIYLLGDQECRNHDLDQEAPAWLELGGDVLEARDLPVLGRQVHDRVEEEVGDPEPAFDGGGRNVADRHAELLRAWLGLQPGDHRFRAVDPVHPQAALGEWEGDPARADAELQRGAVAGQVGKEVDNGIDDRGLEQVGGGHRLDVACIGCAGRTTPGPD
jgi:hypothetical protein